MRPGKGRATLVGITALAVVAGLGLVGVGAWQLLAPAPEQTGAERRTVQQVGRSIDPAEAGRPSRIEIPVLGFEAAVDAMSVGDAAVLDPPAADRVFWLDDYGMPGVGSDNTVYLIGHTSADGRAVFDPLVDRAAQRPTALPGDEIIVTTEHGRVPYEIVSTQRHDKTALADLEDVWEPKAGRLVLITCFFAAAGDTAPDNMVLFARETGRDR